MTSLVVPMPSQFNVPNDKKTHRHDNQDDDSLVVHKKSRLELSSDANASPAFDLGKISKSEKLINFQSSPLDDNVDYISLKSSLDLLKSRSLQIQRDMKELVNLKRCIRTVSDVKEVVSLINTNRDYLREIEYTGSCIKCPRINWSRDYDVDMETLQMDNDTFTNEINERYEIIKRDKLFG